MSKFRNIIARRRPSTPPAGGVPEASSPRPATEARGYVEEAPKWALDAPPPTMGEAARPEAAVSRPATISRRRIWDETDPAASEAAPIVAPSDDAADQGAVSSGTVRPASMTRLIQPVAPEAAPEAPAPTPAAVAKVASAPAQSGRVKTRLLGFHSDDLVPDAFAAETAPAATPSLRCPVGWVVIVEGPGRGASFALSSGLSSIGRADNQTIALNFGDAAVSRESHASIAYDEEENQVLVGHGGKSNLVRLNGKPLLTTEELANGDHIRIGKTTLRYVALCGPDFSWRVDADAGPDDHD